MFLKKAFDDNKVMQDIYSSDRLKRYTLFIIGVVMQAVAFNLFILPTDMVFSINGVAVVINALLGLDPAYIIFLANILLIVASFVYLGKKVTSRTIVGALLYPLFVSLTANVPHYINLGETEPVIVALMGALLYGFGTGIVFRCNYTTGGTDVVKQIVSKVHKKSIGQATIYVEGLIVTAGVFVFGWQSFIYSILSLAVISWITDKVMIGISEHKTFQIITKEADEITQFITKQLHHKVTHLNNKFGFSDSKRKMLLCSIPTKEYYLLKEAIMRIDEDVFFIVTDTYEVQGGE